MAGHSGRPAQVAAWWLRQEEEACDCAALHREHLQGLHAAQVLWGEVSGVGCQAQGTAYLEGGFYRSPSVHDRHLKKLTDRGADMPQLGSVGHT